MMTGMNKLEHYGFEISTSKKLNQISNHQENLDKKEYINQVHSCFNLNHLYLGVDERPNFSFKKSQKATKPSFFRSIFCVILMRHKAQPKPNHAMISF